MDVPLAGVLDGAAVTRVCGSQLVVVDDSAGGTDPGGTDPEGTDPGGTDPDVTTVADGATRGDSDTDGDTAVTGTPDVTEVPEMLTGDGLCDTADVTPAAEDTTDDTPLTEAPDLVETSTAELTPVLPGEDIGVVELIAMETADEAPLVEVTRLLWLDLVTLSDGMPTLEMVCETLSDDIAAPLVAPRLALETTLIIGDATPLEEPPVTVGVTALAVSNAGLELACEIFADGVEAVGTIREDGVADRGDSADVAGLKLADKKSKGT